MLKMMTSRIEVLPEKKLIGMHMRMCLADNKTYQLWHSFMPRSSEIHQRVNTDLISMQVYDTNISFQNFTPATPFKKWAAVEVSSFDHIPDGMDSYILPAGLYAIFLYKGAASAFAPAFHFIFETWLPASDYILDHRPHFELLGAKYKGDDPDSEEEIWIPVTPK